MTVGRVGRVVLSRRWVLWYRFWRPLWHWSSLVSTWVGTKTMHAEAKAYEHPWVTWQREGKKRN
jgi:hypothetical protein